MPQITRLKRPQSISILALLIFLTSCIYLTRLFITIEQWRFLRIELLDFSPTYLIISALFFGLIGFSLTTGVWYGFPIAWHASRIVIPVFLGYYWLERIVFSWLTSWRTPNELFTLGLTIMVMMWVIWSLSHPNTKIYFRVVQNND